jgi:DNA-binding transcriptional MerR regulator/uncharacterized glyoxalase superfamily protein PhnB
MDLTIGEVAEQTGVTVRILRYYEELGLLAPHRDSGGRPRYDASTIDRLYRVRLLRELGTPVADVDPDGAALLPLTTHALAGIDGRIADLARLRERVRTVEARLLGGQEPTDAELVSVLAGMPEAEPVLTRRLTLLVYRDIEAAQRHLVDVFGLRAGELTRDADGVIVHGEVYAGDGVIWLHCESEQFGLASPATLGAASHCMAIDVADVDAHCEGARAAGAEIVYEPTEMPYGVREYGARDSEGGLWSFMQHLPEGSRHG